MTAFFVPGVAPEPNLMEEAYEGMWAQVALDMGRPPSRRRISSVWTRRQGGVDCVTEVGESDPVHGGTVVAIFDMGRHQPFVVWWQQDFGRREHEVLGCNAYSVLEFEG